MVNKKILLFSFLFIIIILTINCSFQINLFKKINKDYLRKNLIISPLTIYQILSLATNGARSDTQSIMLETLESENIFQLNDINYDIFDTLNKYKSIEKSYSIMTKYTPTIDFSEISKKYFTPIESLESVQQVNDCLNQNSQKEKVNIEGELKENIKMILLNSLYYKGEWASKFETKDTQTKKFYTFNNKDLSFEVNMMSQIRFFKYYEDSDIQVVELYYRDNGMSTLIILPKEEIDIDNYIETLNSHSIINIIDNLERKEVQVDLPKFEFDFSLSLVNILKDLKIDFFPFSLGADFSGFSKEGNVFINDVLHKTYLKVTEDGYENEEVSGVNVNNGSNHLNYKKIEINRPFLFFVRNKNLPRGYDLILMCKIEDLK